MIHSHISVPFPGDQEGSNEHGASLNTKEFNLCSRQRSRQTPGAARALLGHSKAVQLLLKDAATSKKKKKIII